MIHSICGQKRSFDAFFQVFLHFFSYKKTFVVIIVRGVKNDWKLTASLSTELICPLSQTFAECRGTISLMVLVCARLQL